MPPSLPSECQALDRDASDWVLRRAHLADRYGSGAVDRRLAIQAADGQITLARRLVGLYRLALGYARLSPSRRSRLDAGLAWSGAWLQNAFLTRLALDRRSP